MVLTKLSSNKSYQIIQAAEEGGYGVPGVVSYNLETIVAVVRAAEKKRSPAQILLFPWALTYADGLLVNLAADACRSASVPISLHLDHAQDAESIRKAADMPFDSIMVDMSHYEKEENLSKTRELVKYCHAKGKTTEAEPGRINGGEDGVMDTGDLEGLLTTPEEAEEFIETGIDFLAPAFGNVHGFYGGPQNVHLDLERLENVKRASHGKVNLVLHGTNEWNAEHFQECVKGGMTRCNVNDVILCNYNKYIKENAGKVPLTTLMEKGTDLMVERLEWLMDVLGSTGKA
ncbi:putative fructose-bisphosphate aldolase [Phaeomoniella chlamydospora]|uniref:Fructose-bisphosphate aldolase n=1 Tax=Phaeomoniella chlamydospora TaxID=158046 RepID=A0A0G2E1I7_PHACM|nr:putative fructose-bisphosphate aldolase [Phaeomoniella chlamydospora]